MTDPLPRLTAALADRFAIERFRAEILSAATCTIRAFFDSSTRDLIYL